MTHADGVKRYKMPDRVIADYLACTIRTEGENEVVLASDYDALAKELAEARRDLQYYIEKDAGASL